MKGPYLFLPSSLEDHRKEFNREYSSNSKNSSPTLEEIWTHFPFLFIKPQINLFSRLMFPFTSSNDFSFKTAQNVQTAFDEFKLKNEVQPVMIYKDCGLASKILIFLAHTSYSVSLI